MSLLKYSFDASGIDIYSSILNGGKLILISKEDELNPNKVVEIMQKEKITRTFLVPKWIEHINKADKELNVNLASLRVIGTGGEIFKPKVAEHMYNKYPKLNILNLYGPTEATMFATYSVVNNENIMSNSISIGKLIPYSRAYIINSYNDVLPTNLKGELILFEDNNSIRNLAKGYLNLNEITESKFIELDDPLTNGKIRAYKTGDIAKINDELEIEYFGRTDDIVKINNGYLVSINEVETKINQIIGEKYKFCVVPINVKTTKALILFIKTNNSLINKNILKKHINSQISFYMRIKEIILIDNFQENNSGKIDRKILKEIAEKKLESRKVVAPTSKTQKKIYEIIRKQCELEQFSIDDDFIDDLGIDSLSLTVIYSLINNNKIKMQDMYTYTTVEELAKFIDEDDIKVKNIRFSNLDIKNNIRKFNLERILITGATGFLGIHILWNLLKNKNTKIIYCLIRNKENISSEQRLYEKLKYYYNINEKEIKQISKKIQVIDGDITQEHFGLNEKDYYNLEKEVKTVINCAANVKHYGKYQKFYNTNVTSVKNLIQFCENGISLAHISTLSIAGFKTEKTEEKIFDENCFYIKQDLGQNPYLLTKLFAEQCLLNSNINVKIFRLGNIMARKKDGKFQENYEQNAFINAFRIMLKLGKIPKDYLEFKVEFSPVDECAKSIVELSQLNCKNRVYHIVNENEICIKDIFNMLDDQNIEIVDSIEFIKSLNNYEEIGSEYIKEYILQNNLNKYSIEQTKQALKKINFKWSKTDKKYIQQIIKIIEK